MSIPELVLSSTTTFFSGNLERVFKKAKQRKIERKNKNLSKKFKKISEKYVIFNAEKLKYYVLVAQYKRKSVFSIGNWGGFCVR